MADPDPLRVQGQAEEAKRIFYLNAVFSHKFEKVKKIFYTRQTSDDGPLTFGELGQDNGFVLYETTIEVIYLFFKKKLRQSQVSLLKTLRPRKAPTRQWR